MRRISTEPRWDTDRWPVGGPWTTSHTLYEFYVKEDCRQRIFDLFAALLASCGASLVETQTNAPILQVMLHTFAQNVRAEAILFEDRFETRLAPEGSGFHPTDPARWGAVEKVGSGSNGRLGGDVQRQYCRSGRSPLPLQPPIWRYLPENRGSVSRQGFRSLSGSGVEESLPGRRQRSRSPLQHRKSGESKDTSESGLRAVWESCGRRSGEKCVLVRRHE